MCGKESDIRVAGSKTSNTCTNILILVAGTPAGTRPDGYTEFLQIRNRINSRSRIHAVFRDVAMPAPRPAME